MGNRVLNRVWKTSNAKGAALIVLVALADWADDATGSSYPGLEAIARKARLTKPGVLGALRALRKLGELEIVPRGYRPPDGGHARNLYRVTTRKVNDVDVNVVDVNDVDVNHVSKIGKRRSEKEVNVAAHPLPVSLNDPSLDPSVDPSGAEPKIGSASPAAVLSFQTIGAGARTWPLTHGQLSKWQSVYPALDVLAECRRACAWLEAQPARRKTARGMPRFLVSWLNRSVDRGGGRTNGPPRASGRTGAPAPDKYAGLMEGV